MKVETVGRVEYGCVKSTKHGHFVPFISVGLVVDGKRVEFRPNIAFKTVEDAREFVVATHKLLSSKESRNFKYDPQGNA